MLKRIKLYINIQRNNRKNQRFSWKEMEGMNHKEEAQFLISKYGSFDEAIKRCSAEIVKLRKAPSLFGRGSDPLFTMWYELSREDSMNELYLIIEEIQEIKNLN